jgi:hypothetical protein
MDEKREEQKPEFYRSTSGDPRIGRADKGYKVGSEFLRVVKIINLDVLSDASGDLVVPAPSSITYEVIGRVTPAPMTDDSFWKQISSANEYFGAGNYWIPCVYSNGLITISTGIANTEYRVQILFTDMHINS